MATVQVNNTQPIRFEADGVIRLNDGTDDLIIRNKDKGTLRFRNSGNDVLRWQENGENKVPLMGDQQICGFTITVKMSKDDANDIWTRVVRKVPSPATGLVFVFPTGQIDVPDYKAATTGRRFPMTNVYVLPEQCEWSSGTEFDMLTLSFECTLQGEPTTY